jgi:membrane-associated phospholipid phosphatase
VPASLLLPFLYFAAIAAAALAMRTSRPGWARALGLSVAGAGLAAAGSLVPPARLPGLRLQDWWPLLLVPIAYWAPAGLAGVPHLPLERWLAARDARLPALTRAHPDAARLAVLDDLLELAYLLVYPLVPAGLLALAWSAPADAGAAFWPPFWMSVLPCYALLPLLPTRTPRDRGQAMATPAAGVRRVNAGVLGLFSNRWNTFPSGHASAAFAIAALLWRVGSPLAAPFGLLALAIGLGAVRGRYHYMADSVAGAALGLAAGLLL